MRMKKRLLRALIACTLLFSAPVARGAPLEAQEPLNDKEFMILLDNRSPAESGIEGRRFSETIAASVTTAFREKGLDPGGQKNRPDETGEPVSEGETASDAGNASGIRHVVVIHSLLDDRRLSWRIAVYDAESAALVASDAYSAYAGLSALTIIDDSARNAAQAWKKNSDATDETATRVETSQDFISRDSGVSVRYGSSASGIFREAGTVEDGKLTGDYTPFAEGAPIHLEVWREGYWTKEAVLPEGVRETPFELPRLHKMTDSAWSWSAGLGRLAGAALSYRWYPRPDRVFFKAENSFWAGTDFMPGASPVLHDELRLGGGVYLQKSRDAKFRYALGTGFSGIATLLTDAPDYDAPTGFDFTLEPLWFTLEYHFPAWAVVFEERIPYALDTGSGFLETGWLTVNGKGPVFFSLGVLYKW